MATYRELQDWTQPAHVNEIQLIVDAASEPSALTPRSSSLSDVIPFTQLDAINQSEYVDMSGYDGDENQSKYDLMGVNASSRKSNTEQINVNKRSIKKSYVKKGNIKKTKSKKTNTKTSSTKTAAAIAAISAKAPKSFQNLPSDSSEGHLTEDMASATYMHQPLDHSKRQIRLLQIAPTLPGRKISCQLRHFDISQCAPPYKALSYTWGAPSPTAEIDIDGRTMKIRENLYAFLLTVQHDFKSWIWIDAICIDQGTVHEREHQVDIMHHIFSGAEEVLVWLGPATDESDAAMDAIKSWKSIDFDCRKTDYLPVSNPLESGRLSQALEELFNRPYWSRVWVIQEILFGRSISVICGCKSFQWSCLDEMHSHDEPYGVFDGFGIFQMRRSGIWGFIPGTARAIIKHKALANSSPAGLGHAKLSEILQSHKYSKCTEIRDKVYALLNLVDGQFRIAVDYSKAPQDIFFEVLTKAVETEPESSKDDFLKLGWSLRWSLGDLNVSDQAWISFIESKFIETRGIPDSEPGVLDGFNVGNFVFKKLKEKGPMKAGNTELGPWLARLEVPADAMQTNLEITHRAIVSKA
jgi:Heterokaryon incompatibility protein (HET)